MKLRVGFFILSQVANVLKLRVRFLGYAVPYAQGMSVMHEAMQALQKTPQTACAQLLFLEHRDTITITRSHGMKNLLKSETELKSLGVDVVETDRGGDATYHGPGQLVGYLVMPLHATQSAHPATYIRKLEGALLKACHNLGAMQAQCIAGFTGIWAPARQDAVDRKLVAIGVGISHGISKHGFALNVWTDLDKMHACIVPCGLVGKGIANLSATLAEQGKQVPPMEQICSVISQALGEAFELELFYDVDFLPEWTHLKAHPLKLDSPL